MGVDFIYPSVNNSSTDSVELESQLSAITIRLMSESFIINEIFIGSDMDRYQFDSPVTRALT